MILSRVRLLPQQRFDLEDYTAEQSAFRTDAKLWTKEFLSNQNYVVKGFAVSGLGLKQATVNMADATLIIPQNTTDFSWFTAPTAYTNITVSDAQLQNGVKNYLELVLNTQTDTTLTKAFWDPAANSGNGAEFNQETDTITDLNITVVASTGGFSGNPDRLPLAIIETDSSGNIIGIRDKRNLFFRLGTPANPQNTFTWGSQQEPQISVTLGSVTGTFSLGETVHFSSGANATVSQAGTTAIKIRLPNSDSFQLSNTVTGITSGATGTLVNYSEEFNNADKDISDFRNMYAALTTELKAVKGTDFWYQVPSNSLSEITKYFSQLRITPHPTNVKKVVISGSDVTRLDGIQLSQSTKKLLLSFSGATINLETGVVLAADDSTALGVNFTPATITTGNYFWYSICLVGTTTNSDNTLNLQVVVTPAASSASSLPAAPKASFANGISLGQVYVKSAGSGTINAITNANIIQLGIGSGSGSSGSILATYLDPISTTLPTGSTVTIDGIAGVNGDRVLYTNLVSGNNAIYQLSGVGTSIAWAIARDFNNGATPSAGESVRISNGVGFATFNAVFDGTNFKVNNIIRLFNGADYWELGALQTSTLADNSSGHIFTVGLTGSENITVEYSILRGSTKDAGHFIMTSDGTSVETARYGANLGITGIDLSADINSGNIRFNYTSTNTGTAATIKYFIKRWSNSAGGPGGVPTYSASSSTTAAAGSTGDVQYNNAGMLAADANFQWDSTNEALVLGSLSTSAMTTALTINDNQSSAATILTFSQTLAKFFVIEYSIIRNTESRIGRLLITHNGTVAAISDDQVDTGGTGIDTSAIIFSTTLSGGNLLVKYTSTSTGFTGTFKYSVRKWI